jgi:small subunit ribosomal protein S16
VSLKIRLRRMGAKKRPFYRIVAIDSHKARDGRFVDILGWYSPIDKPAKVKFHEDKIYHHLDQGAQMSETVASLFKQTGLIEKYQKTKKGEDVSEMIVAETIKEKNKKKKKKTVKAE